MFNKLFAFVQNKAEYLYENSFIIQKIDNLILATILTVLIASIFANTDLIGIIAIFAIILTVIKLFIKKNERIECNNFELFLLIYFIFVMISLFGSTLLNLSMHGFTKTLIYLGFYLVMVQYLKNNKDKIWWVIYTIVGCLCFEAITGLWQSTVHPEAISTWQDTSYLNPEEIMTRVYGTLKPFNPNLFGGYLVAVIPCLAGALIKLLCKKHYKNSILLGVLLLLSIAVLFLTGCRGAYLAFFAMIIISFLIAAKFFWRKYKKNFLIFIASVFTFGSLVLFSVASLRARLFSIFAMREDSSNAFRFNVYQSCFHMFKDNWLLGIGCGNQNFREIYGLYMRTGFDALSAYNIFLEIGVESGIFALISFIAFIALLVYQSINLIFKNIDIKNILVISIALVSIIGLMVHGFVDTVFFRPQIQFIFWTMVAFITVELKSNQ